MMGNRAVIIFDDAPKIGIYLHWNGGRGSVEAFLDEAKRRDIRSPKGDALYCFARFSQIVGEFLAYSGDGQPNYSLSFGAGLADDLDQDNGDNGVYHIDDAFEIRERSHTLQTVADQYDKDCRKSIGEFFAKLEACIVKGMAAGTEASE